MMSVFPTKTPRHKKWGGRTQSRTADEWQNLDSHPGQPGSEAVRRRGRCPPMRSCSFRTVASPRGWRAETRRLSEAGAVTRCLPVCYTGYPILTSRHLFRASVFRDGDRSPLAQSHSGVICDEQSPSASARLRPGHGVEGTRARGRWGRLSSRIKRCRVVGGERGRMTFQRREPAAVTLPGDPGSHPKPRGYQAPPPRYDGARRSFLLRGLLPNPLPSVKS